MTAPPWLLDDRTRLVLDALSRRSEPVGMDRLWWDDLYRLGEGDSPPHVRGRFNYGFCERVFPRLVEAGLVEKTARRFRITEAGRAHLLAHPADVNAQRARVGLPLRAEA